VADAGDELVQAVEDVARQDEAIPRGEAVDAPRMRAEPAVARLADVALELVARACIARRAAPIARWITPGPMR
jgi:hypothetical protein